MPTPKLPIGSGLARARRNRKRAQIPEAKSPTFIALQVALGVITREFRTDMLRMSLLDLERRSGIRKGNLSTIENGKANPCVDTLEKLATSFGLNLATFVRIVEERAAKGGAQ